MVRRKHMVEVIIHTYRRSTFRIQASPYESIWSIKERIQSSQGIPWEQQTLLANGDAMFDSETMADHGITNGSHILLTLEIPINVLIFHYSISITALDMDTVEQLKQKIHKLVDVPVDQFHLFYGITQMQAWSLVADYGLVGSSTLNAYTTRSVAMSSSSRIQIKVAAPDDEDLTLIAQKLDTVRCIKERILDIVAYDVFALGDIFLFHGNKSMKDGRPLLEYGIKDGSELEVITKPLPTKLPTAINIGVVTAKTELCQWVDKNDKVDYIKEKISKTLRTAGEQFELFAGRIKMQSGHSLEDYGFVCYSKMNVVAQVRSPQAPTADVSIGVATNLGEDHELLLVRMEVTAKVWQLKMRISIHTHFPLEQLVLFTGSTMMLDHLSLADYNLRDNSEVKMSRRDSTPAPSARILLNIVISGKGLPIDMDQSDYVWFLKAKILHLRGGCYSADQVVLFIGSLMMQDQRMLMEYGLENNSNLDMVMI